MKKLQIQLKTIDDVKEFVNIVGKCSYDVDLSSGRYVVDAKSIILGYSMVLANPHPAAFNVAYLLSLMKPKAKNISILGSFGWGGKLVEPVSELSTYINDTLTPVVGYRFPTSASISMTYEQFKEYLAYVYDPGENFAYLDSVSVSFNSENALLSTVFNLSKFYIGYDGGAYVGEPEFDMNYGNDNPFRTK